MSDVPCKEFSAALNTAVTELMLREERKPIPAAVLDIQKSLMARRPNYENYCYGVMGSSSQMMRRKSGGLNSNTQYEFHFKLDFPFKLTPIRDQVRPGFVMLQANIDVRHPAVVNGFLDRIALCDWLLSIFSLKSPNLDVFHSKENFCVMTGNFTVAFSPVLEFDHSQWPLPSPGLPTSDLRLQAHPWYAVPKATTPLDSRTFVVWAPDWERFIMDTHHHSHRLLRLMAALGSNISANSVTDHIDHAIRTVMLQEVLNLPRDLGDAMIAFLTAVVTRLQEGRQSRYLVDSINVFQFVGANILEKHHKYFSDALQELKNLKLSARNAAHEENQNLSNNVADDDAGNNDDDFFNHLRDITDTDSDDELVEPWMTKLLKMFV